MFTTKLKLVIPPYLVTTMAWYEDAGYIERNEFIADSIRNHIDCVTTGLGGDNTSPTVELEVQIPALLALKLWWTARRNKTSVSNIVNEALAFSLPNLLEQNQAQEEFRLEIEMTG